MLVGRHHFPTKFGIEVHFRLASLTFLGSDDNNTVSGTSTIDRGSGSILQDCHRLNVVGVQTGKWRNLLTLIRTDTYCVGTEGNTVNNVQRLSAGVQRVATTDENRRRSTRLTRLVSQLKTRNRTLKSLDWVCVGLVGDGFTIHGCSRTGECCFTCYTITGNHDFAKRRFIIGQYNTHVRTGADFQRLHTYIGNAQCFLSIGQS